MHLLISNPMSFLLIWKLRALCSLMPVNFQTELIFMHAVSPKTKLAGPVWHQPCDIQGFLNFSLYWAQQVGAHLLQQLRQQNKQPVLEVLLMDLDEVHQRLQEHTEDLKRMKRTVISWCTMTKAGLTRPSPQGPQGSRGYLSVPLVLVKVFSAR